MKMKPNGFSDAMGPEDGEGSPDSRDDQALWNLMGVLDDVEPSATFADDVKRLVESQKVSRRPWYQKRWVPAAAAALVLAIVIPFSMKKPGLNSNPSVPQEQANYESVVDLLDGLSETDVLALEANEAELVQADYFGD